MEEMKIVKPMDEIKVHLQPPTAHGRLYPRYDAEADLLEVGSSIPRDWLYGVDINGTSIFDLDANRVLANFDLLIRKNLWKVVPLPEWPHASREADIEFSEETIKHKSFNVPLEVQTDQNRSYARILFGGTEHVGT
jgi:hypothetical protein